MESDPDGGREENLGRNVLIASSDKNGNTSEGTAEDALSCSSDTDGDCLVIDTEWAPADNQREEFESYPGQADAPSLPLAFGCGARAKYRNKYRHLFQVHLGNLLPGASESIFVHKSQHDHMLPPTLPSLLKGMLWDAVEEAADYEPPQQGNLVYKLYSLDGMLLLVRTSIQKLEYQAFYGAETLTEDEVCRLWMESLLHSNTSFTVGHVDALTSQLFLLERLTGKALKRRFGTFNPTNSLHILQNILKKVAGYMSRKAKAFPGTPSRQGPISTGSRDGSLQAEPPRKKHGAAQDKGSRPANQGPNRKFWKKKKCPS
ncbi:hypothetical protein E2320_013247 [Naja naja]|nr:hypothetical protein E2320_013247 [Naja naja]